MSRDDVEVTRTALALVLAFSRDEAAYEVLTAEYRFTPKQAQIVRMLASVATTTIGLRDVEDLARQLAAKP
jgi:hypothetical protein